MTELSVRSSERSYSIFFRHQAEQELVERVLGSSPTGRAIVISDTTVAELYAQGFVDQLRGRQHRSIHNETW